MYKKTIYLLIFFISIFTCLGLAACYIEEDVDASYKVEYIVNDNIYYTSKVQNGVLTSFPENPKVSGYVFDGWFLDNKTWKKPLTINTLLDLPLSENNSFKVFAKLTKYRCDLNDAEHIFIVVEEVKETCTERGYKLEKCRDCSYEKNTILQPLKHDYISEITLPAKCSAEGLKTYSCSRENCNHSYTQPIAALQHNYSVQVTTQPTCVTKGIKTYTCLRENCNHSYKESINELQHIFAYETTVEPCVTEGIKNCYCTRENCNYSHTEILPALGYHDCNENGDCIRCLNKNVCSSGFVSNGNILTNYSGSETNIIIPSMFNGVVINKLDYTFLENETIENVYMPDTIEYIGVSAFDGCTSLRKVRMSNNIKVIDSFAFANTAIDSIYLPQKITNINMFAFYDCLNLTTVYYQGSQPSWQNVIIENKNSNLLNATLIFSQAIQPDSTKNETVLK